MIKTQIQLPDELYRRLKQFAARREWSLAETLRRGGELLLDQYPEETAPRGGWKPPEPKAPGCFPLDAESLKRLAQEDENALD